jgi:MFS family permease
MGAMAPDPSEAASQPEPSSRFGVARPVLVLSAVSFLTDVASEMVYPLIPLFLTSVLGAPFAAVGLIEGVAESTASFLKTASGWLSDRLRVRKPLIVAGYALATAAKPLMALAWSWPVVLGVRFIDRAGKGLRTAPRDALIADATPEDRRGRAFGFHRAADNAGAAIGPAIGLGLLAAFDDRFRVVFLIAGIPALLGVACLALLRERRPPAEHFEAPATPFRELGAPFWAFVAVALIFAVGNSSDVFLILRSKDLGLSNTGAVAAYVLFNTVYALLAFPAGIASDRFGRRLVIGGGFFVFALVYLGFGAASSSALVWPLFATYGLYMAMTEGVARAFVTDLVPARDRATALGVFTGAQGAMILVASLLAGALWDAVGPDAPFYLGAATGFLALAALVILLPRFQTRPSPN